MKRLLRKANEDSDRWLQNYIRETFAPKYLPDDEIVNELRSDYPLDGNTTVYRGINFPTKEEYETFISQMQGGQVSFDRVTSWSKSSSEAESFAITTKINGLNFNVLKRYEEARNNNEKVTGYRGIVIQTDATPENTLCDVTKTNFAQESEVILMPGTYTISVFKELKTFKDQFEEEDVNDYVMSLSKWDKDSMAYILQHLTDQLNTDSSEKIYQLYPRKELFTAKIYNRDDSWNGGKNHNVAQIYFDAYFMETVYPILSEEVQVEVNQQIEDEVNNGIQQINNSDVTLFTGTPLSQISPYLPPGTSSQLYAPLQKLVKQYYEEANNNTKQRFDNNDVPDRSDVKKIYEDFIQNTSML